MVTALIVGGVLGLFGAGIAMAKGFEKRNSDVAKLNRQQQEIEKQKQESLMQQALALSQAQEQAKIAKEKVKIQTDNKLANIELSRKLTKESTDLSLENTSNLGAIQSKIATNSILSQAINNINAKGKLELETSKSLAQNKLFKSEYERSLNRNNENTLLNVQLNRLGYLNSMKGAIFNENSKYKTLDMNKIQTINNLEQANRYIDINLKQTTEKIKLNKNILTSRVNRKKRFLQDDINMLNSSTATAGIVMGALGTGFNVASQTATSVYPIAEKMGWK